MKAIDRIILLVLAGGLWACAALLIARPGPADAELTQRSLQAVIETCRVNGTVTGRVTGTAQGTVSGDIQLRQGSFGQLQNGRITYARVEGRLESGRMINGQISCPGTN